MRTSLLPFFISFVFLSLLSCQKEQSASEGSRLKMIRIKEDDSVFYRSFFYDDQNRISSVVDSNNNGHKWQFSIRYDGQGKLAEIIQSGSTLMFESDNKGRIIKKSIIRTGQGADVENTYNYDTNGRLVADSVYDYLTKAVYRIVSYSYDQAGNITESKVVDKASGALLVQVQNTYDNHPHPLDGKTVLAYLINGEYEIPSGKNNLLKQVYQDGTIVNYSYEYNSNGLPTHCSYYDSSDPLITYIDFFYE
jgi:hypothetical protein